MLSPHDLYTLPVVSGGALQPAKRTVAYCVSLAHEQSNSYHASLRVADLCDGTTRTFTFGAHRDMSPQWSADGEQLFFMSDRSGSTQLWSIGYSGGEPQPLPILAGNVSEFTVSPDGQHLAAIATADGTKKCIQERGWRRVTQLRYRADGVGYLDDGSQLWLIDLCERRVRELTEGSGFAAAPAWSKDGKRLAFAAENSPDADMLWHHELWVADAERDFRPRKIVHMEGALEAPAWSPDGSAIAFIGMAERTGSAGLKNMRLFSAAADGSGLRCWTADAQWTASNLVLTDTGIAGNIPPPVWRQPASIAVVGTERGCARLFLVSSNGSALALTPNTHCVVQFDCADDTGAIVTASDAVTPPELYVCQQGREQWRQDAERPQRDTARPRQANELRRLTYETRDWCAAAGLRRPARFSAPGPAGAIDAWHLRSDAQTPAPAVLQIHGGPHLSYGEAFFFEFQLLAAHGFDVVYCNPRGSQSYGEAFAGAIKGDWAAPAFTDCMAALDKALELHGMDASRLAVAGGSYGGYLTLWTISHTTRFAAAIAMRPAVNLTSLWGTSEVGRMLNDELGGRPNDIPEIYRRCSPLTYADAIATPLLITQGEDDYRCPPEQAEQLFSALRERGQTVELLRFLNADHGMSRTGAPRARVTRLEAILDWLEKYLAAAGAPHRALAETAP